MPTLGELQAEFNDLQLQANQILLEASAHRYRPNPESRKETLKKYRRVKVQMKALNEKIRAHRDEHVCESDIRLA